MADRSRSDIRPQRGAPDPHYDPGFQTAAEAVGLQQRGRSLGTRTANLVAHPPGLQPPSNGNANREVLMNVANALNVIQQTLHAQQMPPPLLPARMIADDPKAAFKKLPSEIQTKCNKEAEMLGNLFGKLARYRRHKADSDAGKLHPRAAAFLKTGIQLSKEDLTHTTDFNIAVEYEAMQKKMSKEWQDFANKTNAQRIKTYTLLTKPESFNERIQNIVKGIISDNMRDAEFNRSITVWTIATFREVAMKADIDDRKRADKNEKFKKLKAEAKARVETLNNEEQLFAGLLEAAKIFPQTPTGDNRPKNPLETTKPVHKVSANSVIGVWAKKFERVAQHYRIAVDNDTLDVRQPTNTSAPRSASNHRSASRQRNATKPPSRPPSTSRPKPSSRPPSIKSQRGNSQRAPSQRARSRSQGARNRSQSSRPSSVKSRPVHALQPSI
eukprot:TRINITY_DN24495_c0_g1_i2.p1 TRINITY_DN24495_c0_g1~~TRINITY_DN24495_c0_g1_i2.p1  ORF type:complete len:442 (+),score=50.00 TRINITY_DN24495_c0_g1_i2:168-1493(+)